MRSRVAVIALLLLALVLPAQAIDRQYIYKNAALPATTTPVVFTIAAQECLIQNLNATGGISIYVDFVGGTATSADYELIGGSAITVAGEINSNGGVRTFDRISLISASATSNVQVFCK